MIIGLIEGVITVAVLSYLQQVRADVVADSLPGKIRLSRKALLATLAVFTIVIAGGLSIFASGMPDGLEWSYAQTTGPDNFQPAVANNPHPGWTSFAGIAGAIATMIFIWLGAAILRKKQLAKP